MAGSYIDPCGSGAFEGSGSWDTGSTGSWSGSGSGNDQLTGSNCCKNSATGKACCIGGNLKLKLFALHPQYYTDPDAVVSDPTSWSEIEDSRIYTLSKTIFCSDNGNIEERWVVKDPDQFSIFGNIEGMYFTDSIYDSTFLNSKLPFGYGLLYFKINGEQKAILMDIWCKCYSSVILQTQTGSLNGSIANDSLASCSNSFLSRSTFQAYIGDSTIANNFHAMIWGDDTNIENEFGISSTPPTYLTVSSYASNINAFGTYVHTDGLSNYSFISNSYFKRVYRKFNYSMFTSNTTYPAPPFYCYVPCEFPYVKGNPRVPTNNYDRQAARYQYVVYGNQIVFSKNTSEVSNYGYNSPYIVKTTEPTLTCVDNSGSNNTNTIYSKTRGNCTSIHLWMGYSIGDYSYVTLSSITKNILDCYITKNIINDQGSFNWNSNCNAIPSSISPFYDTCLPLGLPTNSTGGDVYTNSYVRVSGTVPIMNTCIGSIPYPPSSGWPTGYTTQIVSNKNYKCFVTEGINCPPYTYSGSLPGSGSTPVSGSTPTSGSTPGSGSGSGSGSAPVTCYGGCAYNITSYVSGGDGYGWNWILTGTYAGNVCSTGCGCSNTGTITFSYWGPEGGWPNPLYFPCDPGAGGGSGGSSGSGSGSSSGSGSGSSSGSGSTSGGSTSSSGSGFIMIPE